VADTINAVYEGNMRSPVSGLGLFRKQSCISARSSHWQESSLLELTFGHGTSNGRMLRGTLAHGVG
jgi:hypothetical protein